MFRIYSRKLKTTKLVQQEGNGHLVFIRVSESVCLNADVVAYSATGYSGRVVLTVPDAYTPTDVDTNISYKLRLFCDRVWSIVYSATKYVLAWFSKKNIDC